ncbi:MAG TPA: hypothetical protein VG097_03895 [Gemmata sp.]|nr:hypothetical protein [Gemmata sp.]
MADEPDRTQHVTLGCGTLILIALIVMIFSHSGTGELKMEVQSLRSEVKELKQSIDTQANEIKLLREGMLKGKGKE